MATNVVSDQEVVVERARDPLAGYRRSPGLAAIG